MEAPRARVPAIPAAALIALPALLGLAWAMDFLVDDAFISFRYGRHLAEGHGLVWNIGEEPPVEGFSNFLWTLLCAGLELAGLAPELWTRLVGVACACGLVVQVARVASARLGGGASATLAALCSATAAPIAVWSTGGLETMAFALCVFGVFERLVLERAAPRALGASLWAALAVLVRADGFVWIAMSSLAALAVADASERRAMLRAVLVVALATLATTLAYLAFRCAYFEALGPNTARIKVAFGSQYLLRGAQYVASLCLCVASVPIVLAGSSARLGRERSRLAHGALVFCASAFAYLIVLGGDWMMMYRMLVPALPFVALALGAWLATFAHAALRVVVGVPLVVLGALPCFDVHAVPQSLRERAHFRWSQEFRSEHAMWKKGVVDIRDWIEVGRALEVATEPGESIVLGNIGAFGYYATELVVHDMHGLTNREPLEPLDPAAREMPGHDRKIGFEAFAKYQPTYFNARVVEAAAPWTILPKAWQSLDPSGAIVGPNDAARAKYEFVLAPLDPAQGFRAGTALLLIRYRR
ncbi:MAG: hypothetical protein FJ298_10865 [Planctomycetes bacterium]|nr:hypothetical protein [Planctomycetota bacterium]